MGGNFLSFIDIFSSGLIPKNCVYIYIYIYIIYIYILFGAATTRQNLKQGQ